MPAPDLVRDLLEEVHAELVDLRDGEVLQGVPSLAGIDEDAFGLCVAMADGGLHAVGDTQVPFCLQSISKALTYGLALADRGHDAVDEVIDMEPSGDAFNEISLERETGRPRNAMINAGAIAAASLVLGEPTAEQSARVHAFYESCAGRALEVDEAVLADELRTGHRNRAISHLLREHDRLATEPDEAIEVYLRQCSVLVTGEDLGRIGATLANNGVNPWTGERALDPPHVERVLSVMATCGMYDAAGEWVAKVGLAAKSGVGGGIVAVLPGQLALAVFSPRLDPRGNSVRGIEACRRLSQRLGLHALHVTRGARSVVRVAYDLSEASTALGRPEADRDVLERCGDRARVYELHGDLLFAGAESVLARLAAEGPDLDYVVVDVRGVDEVSDIARDLLVGLRGLLRDAGCEPVVVDHPEPVLGTLPDGDAASPPTPAFTTRVAAVRWVEDRLLERHRDPDASAAERPLAPEEHPLLDALPAAGRARLLDALVAVDAADGEEVVGRGDEDRGAFLLLAGRVRQSIAFGEDDPRVVATLVAGAVLGDVALVTDGAHAMTATADGDARLVELPRAAFAALQDDPALRGALLEALFRARAAEQERVLAVLARSQAARPALA